MGGDAIVGIKITGDDTCVCHIAVLGFECKSLIGFLALRAISHGVGVAIHLNESLLWGDGRKLGIGVETEAMDGGATIFALGAFLQAQGVGALLQFVGKHNGVAFLTRHLNLLLQLTVDKHIVVACASVGYIHCHAGACELRLHIHAHPVVSHTSVIKFFHSAREAHVLIDSLHVFVAGSCCHCYHGENHSDIQFFSHNINNVD